MRKQPRLPQWALATAWHLPEQRKLELVRQFYREGTTVAHCARLNGFTEQSFRDIIREMRARYIFTGERAGEEPA